MEKKRRGLSAGGILGILALVLIPLAVGVFLMPGGSGKGNYDSYAGPVLPMTAISGSEQLQVKRNVDFDFAAYTRERENILDTGSAVITDTYELINTSGEEVTVELAYGFEGQFTDPQEQFPEITVDGVSAQTEILASVDADGSLHRAGNWETYKQVLLEQAPLDCALTTAAVPEMPVTMVRLSEFVYRTPHSDAQVFVGAEFALPEGTVVWTPHFDMTRQEQELWQVYGREEVVLYFSGTMPGEITPVVNAGYNVTESSIMAVEAAHVERSEADLAACLRSEAEKYDFWADNAGYPNPGCLTTELLYDGALKLLSDPDYRNPSGEIQAFSSVFYDVVSDIRILYQVFSVTVPAGESVTVEAVFTQEPSTDFAGPRKYREGYDMATTFGSCLSFSEQTASVTNEENIEIVKQNFGFDLKRNITSVELDLKVERYYLDVAAK